MSIYLKNELKKSLKNKFPIMVSIMLVLNILFFYKDIHMIMQSAGYTFIFFDGLAKMLLFMLAFDIIYIISTVQIEMKGGIILNNFISKINLKKMIISKITILYIINLVYLIFYIIFTIGIMKLINYSYSINEIIKILGFMIPLIAVYSLALLSILIISFLLAKNMVLYISSIAVYLIYIPIVKGFFDGTIGDYIIGYSHPMGNVMTIMNHLIVQNFDQSITNIKLPVTSLPIAVGLFLLWNIILLTLFERLFKRMIIYKI